VRLWHQELIPKLPNKQLLGQHRECCALRGKGWGRKHATVDYVFKYPPITLYFYHQKIMHEMDIRGYKVAPEWRDQSYRGKNCKRWTMERFFCGVLYPSEFIEHNDNYLRECLNNLANKGVVIDF
jgi:uncharacterized protein (TIGR02328 family)